MKEQEVRQDIKFASMAEEMRSIRHRINQLKWIEKRTVDEMAELEGLYKRLRELSLEMTELTRAFDHEVFEYEYLVGPTNKFFRAFGTIAVIFVIIAGGILCFYTIDLSTTNKIFALVYSGAALVSIFVYYFGYIRKSDR